MEELTSSRIAMKLSPGSSFSFSLQVLALTPSHLICQEVLRWGQQSSAPSCDEAKIRAITSLKATGVTRCAAVTELRMSESHQCFSLWSEKCVSAETTEGSSRKRPIRTTIQTRVLLPVFIEHTIENGLTLPHSIVPTASSHFRCWL